MRYQAILRLNMSIAILLMITILLTITILRMGYNFRKLLMVEDKFRHPEDLSIKAIKLGHQLRLRVQEIAIGIYLAVGDYMGHI